MKGTRRNRIVIGMWMAILGFAAVGCSESAAVRERLDGLDARVADTLEMAQRVDLEDGALAAENVPYPDFMESDWNYPAGEITSVHKDFPGAPGAECNEDRDCATNLCMDMGYGYQCAGRCVEECGEGMHCGTIEGEADLYCLPDYLPVCRPCREAGDCRRFHGDNATVCVLAHGPGAYVCLERCGEGDCNEGWFCSDDGVCEPESGVCVCAGVTSLDKEGVCVNTSEAGTCAGAVSCQAGVLSECSAAIPQAEACDGLDNDCDGESDEEIASAECVLANDFGACSGATQCADGETRCVGQEPKAESCNGIDDDCDGSIDEEGSSGCVLYYLDGDQDGFGGETQACLCQIAEGWVPNRQDCDDTDASVNPSMVEVCEGKDTDCDGIADDGCDLDGDGYCGLQALVWGAGLVCLWPELDCLDVDPDVHPGALERCNAVDDQCDGQVDEGCDLDGDGYCNQAALVWGAAYVCKAAALDCDDNQSTIHPGGSEVCDGRDNNCSGKVDETCDPDGDGYCGGTMPLFHLLCLLSAGGLSTMCAAAVAACPEGYDDCAPNQPGIYPGAGERCNGVDDDCDGTVDDGIDADGDGYCAPGVVKEAACSVCPGVAPDCDDSRGDVYVGAPDVPDLLGLDSDCDGLDGQLSATLFVDPVAGNDVWSGSLTQPKRTLKSALAEAGKSVSYKTVFAAVGTYEESIVVPEGVRLWGGFDPGAGWAVATEGSSLILGDTMPVRITGAVATTVVGRMRIEAASATLVGASSHGVVAVDSPGVVLDGLEISAGKGAVGAAGYDGMDGVAGETGQDGGNGCMKGPWGLCYHPWSDNTCAGPSQGGGSPFSKRCGGTGHGLEPLDVVGVWDPAILAQWDPAVQAEPSCCYKLLGEEKGGEPGLYHNTDATPGSAGGDGVAGLPGYHGKGGAGLGELGSWGWYGIKGGNGGDGGYGCGGGGGGHGDNKGGTICDYKGGGGGGGGAGGSGGTSGLGGGAGGGSVGVALVRSAGIVRQCRVVTAGGGKGGKGGAPGRGGSGGKGGKGGPGLEDSGHGGAGGDGGEGGRGGVGGGGLGGASCGVVYSSAYKPVIEGLDVELGPAGSGGTEGPIEANVPPSQVAPNPTVLSKGKAGPRLDVLPVP